jgi:hypothetical protein
MPHHLIPHLGVNVHQQYLMKNRFLEYPLPLESPPQMYIDRPPNQAQLTPSLLRPQLLELELDRMIDREHYLAYLLLLDNLPQKHPEFQLKSVEITLPVHDLRNIDLFPLLRSHQSLLSQ